MQAMAEFEEIAIECDFVYPFNEPPVIGAGPMGSQSWQKPIYNAKLILSQIIEFPNEFVIKCGEKTYSCVSHVQRGFDGFCKVSAI